MHYKFNHNPAYFFYSKPRNPIQIHPSYLSTGQVSTNEQSTQFYAHRSHKTN